MAALMRVGRWEDVFNQSWWGFGAHARLHNRERKWNHFYNNLYCMSPCHKSLKKKRAENAATIIPRKKQKKQKQENFLLSFIDYVSGYIKAIVKR